jgi:hypothetical protein
MKTAARILGGLIGLVALALIALFVGARFADGPLEIVTGGPFRTGEWHTGPEPDWTFLRDRGTVEFQLLEPARARTTFVMIHDGRVFIPSGYMTTWYGKIWKHWPYQAEQDPRAILRVDGRRYERTLVRLEGGPDLRPVLAELSRKYGSGLEISPEQVESGDLWLFELAPRRP